MPRDCVKSVERTFRILEHLRRAKAALTLAQIARPLSLPPSSTMEILKSMAALGYLTFDPVGKTYLPTLNLSRLGSWLPDAERTPEELRAFIRDLAARSGLSVFVSQLNDLYAEHVGFAVRSDAPRLFDASLSVPALLTAPGVLLFSAETADAVDRLYRRSAAARLIDRSALSAGDVRSVCDRLRVEEAAVFQDWPAPGGAALTARLPFRLAGRPVALGMGGVSELVVGREVELRRMLTDALAVLGLGGPDGGVESPIPLIDGGAFGDAYWPERYIVTPLEDASLD